MNMWTCQGRFGQQANLELDLHPPAVVGVKGGDGGGEGNTNRKAALRLNQFNHEIIWASSSYDKHHIIIWGSSYDDNMIIILSNGDHTIIPEGNIIIRKAALTGWKHFNLFAWLINFTATMFWWNFFFGNVQHFRTHMADCSRIQPVLALCKFKSRMPCWHCQQWQRWLMKMVTMITMTMTMMTVMMMMAIVRVPFTVGHNSEMIMMMMTMPMITMTMTMTMTMMMMTFVRLPSTVVSA